MMIPEDKIYELSRDMDDILEENGKAIKKKQHEENKSLGVAQAYIDMAENILHAWSSKEEGKDE